jgi:hypothetical protein
MKNKFHVAIMMLLIVVACSKGQIQVINPNSDSVSSGKSFSSTPVSEPHVKNIPDCIKNKINDAINANGNSVGTGRFVISEYLYQGNKVYTISTGNWDIGIPIYDENCNNICVIGGFIATSTQLCNGEVFFDKALKLRDLYTF